MTNAVLCNQKLCQSYYSFIKWTPRNRAKRKEMKKFSVISNIFDYLDVQIGVIRLT